jgi:hypothetical protein
MMGDKGEAKKAKRAKEAKKTEILPFLPFLFLFVYTKTKLYRRLLLAFCALFLHPRCVLSTE